MISSVNNRPHAPQRQNFQGAKIALRYISEKNGNYYHRGIVTSFHPQEALLKLQEILKKGVDNLSEQLSISQLPIGKKGSTKKVIDYSPDLFSSRANRRENLSYSIRFSRDRKDSAEYKKAFAELSEKIEKQHEEDMKKYCPKVLRKGITRS